MQRFPLLEILSSSQQHIDQDLQQTETVYTHLNIKSSLHYCLEMVNTAQTLCRAEFEVKFVNTYDETGMTVRHT